MARGLWKTPASPIAEKARRVIVMCGIAGFIAPENEASARSRLARMTEALAHRGPDGEGAVILPAGVPPWVVALGHRRLAILDLSEAGRQPMSTPDKAHWMTYNGEVYNFQELRRELQDRGVHFHSRCDSEVLLHLLAQEGPGALSRLNGMWAIGYWNERTRTLLLARDRLGIKPLYYYHDPAAGVFVFGSEIKALLTAGVPRDLRPEGLAEYFCVGHCLDPHTMFRDVRQLEAGHYLIYRDGRCELRPFWELRTFLEDCAPTTPESLLHYLDDSVRLRLVSDVPVGAFLSGGVDSSAIVGAMAATKDNGDIRTFCISFPGSVVDEARYARRMAEHVGAVHRELTFQPDGMAILDDAVRHNDEPFADDAFLPTYMMCRVARGEVKVALSGDGGDELFAGYDKYKTEQVANKLGPGGQWTLRGLAKGAGAIATAPMPVTLRDRIAWLQRMLDTAGMEPAERYVAKLSVVSPDLADDLGVAHVRGAHGRIRRCFDELRTSDVFKRMFNADVRLGLANNMLRKVDRMSMAWGLEVRVPLLDYRIVQLAARLPSSQRIQRLRPKYLLREAVRGRVPADLLHRRKQGFDVPIAQWFRGDFAGTVRDVIAETDGMPLNANTVKDLLVVHETGAADVARALFAIVSFAVWHRLYVSRRAYAAPPDHSLPT